MAVPNRSHVVIGALALSLLGSPLAGQAVFPTDVRPKSCPATDSLLRTPSRQRTERLWYFWLPRIPRREVVTPKPPFTTRPGIIAVYASLNWTADTLTPVTELQLEIKVGSRAARGIEERQLHLVGDDTLDLDQGSVTAELQDCPGTSLAVENMVAIIPFTEIAPLLRARRIHLMLGTTKYETPMTVHRRLASLTTAGICGWSVE